jgi:hypothetical protein
MQMSNDISYENSKLKKLLWNLDAAELRSFLRINKKLLMTNSVRFRHDNLPNAHSDVVSLIAGFSANANSIFNKWLQTKVTNRSLEISSALEIIKQDDSGVPVGPAELQEACVTVLAAATSKEVPKTVIDYLVVPPPKESRAPELVPTSENSPVTTSIQNSESDSLLEINNINEETDEIIARCKHITADGRSAFSEVIGIKRSGKWYRLDSYSSKKNLFPSSGDIYIPLAQLAWRQDVDDLGVWRVHKQTDTGAHQTTYRAVESLGHVYKVRDIPFASIDAHAVREWFRQLIKPEDVYKFIYKTNDGIYLKLKHIPSIATYDFSDPIEGWTSLMLYPAIVGNITIGTLPPAQRTCDLADEAILLKRLLQQFQSSGLFPKFTKAHVTELGNWIKSNPDMASTTQRYQRVISALETVCEQTDLLEMMAGELLKHPAINKVVDERIQKAEKTYLAKKSSLVAEVEALEKKRSTVTKAIDSLSTRETEVSQKLSKAVKRAFQRAVKDGEDTLAQSAVFSALIERKQPQVVTSETGSATDRRLSVTIHEAVTLRPLVDVLSENGIRTRDGTFMAQIISIVSAAGMIIAFRGRGAQLIAEASTLAFSKLHTAIVQIRPDLIDSGEIDDLLAGQNKLSAICLLSANTAASESYASSLERMLWKRIVSNNAKNEPVVFITLVDGPTALPLSTSLRALTIQVDLDNLTTNPDPGLNYDNWVDEVMEAIREKGIDSALSYLLVRRIRDHLPGDVTPEIMTFLKDGLFKANAA